MVVTMAAQTRQLTPAVVVEVQEMVELHLEQALQEEVVPVLYLSVIHMLHL
jgi:hypothetical protein